MKVSTAKRLGRALAIARPLSPLEERAAKLWFKGRNYSDILRMRIEATGHRFCVIQGGRR